MYLKSLVLKGFKSFADRAVLSLEPGITAVVGPNGSGKSNILDAVLWVLGERSARSLRGQSMEDIIFSGSVARKAVSVAEVDLVLDNSDGTLAISFDEVVITRRMYRSGESEYLVNGVVSRRLDVLDILHDTGLGTGTHSIISQGELDSILQSNPEDRRALIEEAAGVLKHKRRKEKSARKLEQMDNHLIRVRDIAAEIQRQLGPLERKAKRAQIYLEASEKLADLKLALAVDNLRILQVQWDAACAAEERLADEVVIQKASFKAAEERVNDFQELLRRESEDAGELAKQARRAASIAEKLSSSEMLVKERRRATLNYEAEMRLSLENSAVQREEAQRDLKNAQHILETVQASLHDAHKLVEHYSEQQHDARERFVEIDAAMHELTLSIKQCEEETDTTKHELALLRENLSNDLAHMKLVKARKVELETELDSVRIEHEEATKDAEKASAKLEELKHQEFEAQNHLALCLNERDAAHSTFEKKREQHQMLDSEIKAIERSLQMTREDDPSLAWLMGNAESFEASLEPVVASLKVASAYEELVEALLGEDLSVLALKDSAQAEEVVRALKEGNLSGNVSVVMSSSCTSRVSEAQACSIGHALIDDLTFPNRMKPIVEALLGDVVICKSYQEAFDAHKHDQIGLRFVSKDGCAIWPSGKVRVYGKSNEVTQGVLARERQLSEARKSLLRCDKELITAEKKVEASDEAYSQIQASSLRISQELAHHKGISAALLTEKERTGNRLSGILHEIENLNTQIEVASKTLDELRPNVEAKEAFIAELEEKHACLIRRRDVKTDATEAVRNELTKVSENLADAKLTYATLEERKEYAERTIMAHKRDIEVMNDNVSDVRHSLAIKDKVIVRAAELLEIFAQLSNNIQRRIRILDKAVNASESTTSSVHLQAASAQEVARAAHNSYDEANSRLAQAQIEKSRLEVQVKAAIERVVVTCDTPLDVAEQLPKLVQRSMVEDEILQLESQVKKMGTINLDAAEEYTDLKERYDYLAGQLSDMETARRSLSRIVNVIDSRMKDDFVRVFEEVNKNFNEIFQLLFPGGTAHLSFEDPDDIEHSGVEVTAQPRGKRLTKMMLMSGGEKSLTALALLFAVYKTRSTPFYILDEVEAALDDTNLRRLITYIDSLRSSSQLIMITHQRRTMEMADVLFGVSMQADGVTKVISQKLEHALAQVE